MIVGLMLAFFATILNFSMFAVAAPQIRIEYSLAADTTSWLSIVFSIPYILLMPFYGRLGDLLGKRRLLLAGSLVYALGSGVCFVAGGFVALIVGRIVQGIGAAAVNPLCLSIISERVSAERRGKAIGTWSTSGPFTGIFGPIVGGALIETFGWRSIFAPTVIMTILSLFFILRLVPPDRHRGDILPVLRSLDWRGFLLLSVGLTFTVFYISSRAITGRSPLSDWRLLAAAVAALVPFVLWERRAAHPMIDFRLLKRRNFLTASITVGFRMILLGGVSFLVPLYASDLLHYGATETGLVVMTHAAFLFLTVRLGGIFADKWSNRKPVAIGLFLQSCCFGALALQSGSGRVLFVLLPLMVSGAAAGLSLAALHHTAMHELLPADSGAGAGIYSMIRFTGSLLGAAVPGIVLETGLATLPTTASAYRAAFLAITVAGVIGTITALLIREISWKRPVRIANGM